MRVKLDTGKFMDLDDVQAICVRTSFDKTCVSDGTASDHAVDFSCTSEELVLDCGEDGYKIRGSGETGFPWIFAGMLESPSRIAMRHYSSCYGSSAYVRKDDIDIPATARVNSVEDTRSYFLVLKSGLFLEIAGSLSGLMERLGARIGRNPIYRMMGKDLIHPCSVIEVRMFPVKELGIKLVTVLRNDAARNHRIRPYPIRRTAERILRSMGLSMAWFRKTEGPGGGTVYVNRRHLPEDKLNRLDFKNRRYRRKDESDRQHAVHRGRRGGIARQPGREDGPGSREGIRQSVRGGPGGPGAGGVPGKGSGKVLL